MTEDVAAARDALLAEPAAGADPAVPARSLEEVRAELAALEAAEPAPPGTVKLKVELPHQSMTFGGITVGNDWTAVPAAHVQKIMTAAGDAGVTISTEGES
jgi:hypothetical protein